MNAQPLLPLPFVANDTTPATPRPRRFDRYPRARRPFVRVPRHVLDANGREEEAALAELPVCTELVCVLAWGEDGEPAVKVLPTLWTGAVTVIAVGKQAGEGGDGASWWCERFVCPDTATLARRATAWLSTFDLPHVARAESLDLEADGRVVLRLRREVDGWRAIDATEHAARLTRIPVVTVRAGHAECTEYAHGA